MALIAVPVLFFPVRALIAVAIVKYRRAERRAFFRSIYEPHRRRFWF